MNYFYFAKKNIQNIGTSVTFVLCKCILQAYSCMNLKSINNKKKELMKKKLVLRPEDPN